jgi:hypothetical protein
MLFHIQARLYPEGLRALCVIIVAQTIPARAAMPESIENDFWY